MRSHCTRIHFFTKDSFLIHDIDDDALDMFFVLTKLLHIHTTNHPTILQNTIYTYLRVYFARFMLYI